MKLPTDYIKLLILRPITGPDRYLSALRATADYYGWTKEFEEWTFQPEVEQGGRRFGRDPGRKGHPQCSSGYRVRICRSPVMNGLPAGFTNAFKVTSNVGLFDLAELAHFTDVDWEWMTDPTGCRISRAQWLDRYAAKTH